MNLYRRKKLQEAEAMLETILDEEKDSFDNMGPGLQASPAGQRTEENIMCLEGAISELQNID